MFVTRLLSDDVNLDQIEDIDAFFGDGAYNAVLENPDNQNSKIANLEKNWVSDGANVVAKAADPSESTQLSIKEILNQPVKV